MGDVATRIVLSILFVLGISCFVAAEYSFVSSRRSKVDSLAKRKHRSAKLLAKALRELSVYIALFDIGITAFNLLVGRYVEPFVTEALSGMFGTAVDKGVSFAIAFTLVTFFTVLIGEVIPKYVGIHSPEKVALLFVRPMVLLRLLLFPLIWLIQKSGSAMLKPFGIDVTSHGSEALPREELALLVQAGGAEGLLKRSHAEVVSRALRLDTLNAHDIMIHRLDILWLDVDVKKTELISKLARIPHTRIPVCRGDVDDVVGVVYLHDIIKNWEKADFSVERLAKPTVIVPENLSVDKIITTMREEKTQMLIVADEYGGTSGLITLEDVVEEVFGELEDRLESERPPIDIQTAGRVSAKADVRFDELVARLGVDTAEEPSTDTLATIMVEGLGRMPRLGDHIETELGVLRVENMARRRITRISLQLKPGLKSIAKDL